MTEELPMSEKSKENSGVLRPAEEVPQQEINAQTASADVKHDPYHHKDKKVKISEQELHQLQAKAQELATVKDTLLRRMADFENAKKRLEREKDDYHKFANEKIIQAFLPVLDNLDRALAHRTNDVTADSLLAGIDLIKKQIDDILKSFGLRKVETVGKLFDPHMHEAMGTVSTDAYPPDSVVEEIQPGYFLKDKLLRPAWVRIAAGGEKIENSSPEGTNLNDSDDFTV